MELCGTHTRSVSPIQKHEIDKKPDYDDPLQPYANQSFGQLSPLAIINVLRALIAAVAIPPTSIE
jgi:hypothetical protein